ncbi:MAG: MBL fold metallo-hydrolase [Candidatus Aminicenantes bacterium]|nr:MBL fold metallo-hydrolase [Candidatus Aminicenantes bacterium]MBL7084300.1 MBL fold metallo-hydrolase [Candidatus Aminicenantes bacterium]NQT81191.1 MBL fold metallo-hydrolase [Candidatus Aminicenantes bacterium]
MNYEMLIVGALETNCYLVYCTETLECAVVDPGAEAERIFKVIAEKNLKPSLLLNTHGHVDHIGANKDIKERFGVPLYIHSADSPMLEVVHQTEMAAFLGAKDSPPADYFFKDGDKLKIGKSFLQVIHTPGHSPGSVSFLGNGFLLSGDTLFYGGVGRTDLPGGSWQELESSIKNRILTMPDEMLVLTGHGPSTTVGQEKRSNPFIT